MLDLYSSSDCFSFTFIVAANQDHVLQNNLLASPLFAEKNKHEVIIQKGFQSAGSAYNHGIERAKNEHIVLVHQDVYLPQNWDVHLSSIIAQLNLADIKWGVLGCFGITGHGMSAGYIYSNGLKRILGEPAQPRKVRSLDEVVLIINKNRSLIFDPGLPSFHFYGTDICLQAEKLGFQNFAISNFCVHNSLPVHRFPEDFWESAKYMRHKWKRLLPVQTSCITLHRSFLKLWLLRMKLEMFSSQNGSAKSDSQRRESPAGIMAKLLAETCYGTN